MPQVPSGVLYVSVFNPVSPPYAIGYSITVKTTANCINMCSGKGTCGADGKCACQVSCRLAVTQGDNFSVTHIRSSCRRGSRAWTAPSTLSSWPS